MQNSRTVKNEGKQYEIFGSYNPSLQKIGTHNFLYMLWSRVRIFVSPCLWQKEIGEVIEFIKKGNLYLSYRTFIGGV